MELYSRMTALQDLPKMRATLYCLAIFCTSGCIAFLTGDLIISPINVKSEPGDNVSFFCRSSKSVSTFNWSTFEESERFQEIRVNDSTSQLILNSVGIAPRLGGYNHITCSAPNEDQHAGTVLYVGYSPLAPKVECFMQNLDVLHCRWSNCDPRLENHPEWRQENEYSVAYRATHYPEHYLAQGKCNGPESSVSWCSSFCSSTTHESKWRYWTDMAINVTVKNEMGNNSSKIIFTPRLNVVLSPPLLQIVPVSTGNDGMTIRLVARFKQHVKEPRFFNYCKDDFRFEVLYKVVPANFSLGSIKIYTEENFWNDWNQRNTTMTKKETDLMIGSKRVTNSSKEEVTIPFLPGNIHILIQAKWKLFGSRCDGNWSTGSYITYRTKDLEPSAFHETALLFFKESTDILPSVFKSGDITASSIMIWAHTEQSNLIHQYVNFEYQTTSNDERCLSKTTAPKSSNFMRLNVKRTQHECKLHVSARNEMGETSSSNFSLAPDQGNCIVRIISVRVISFLKLRVRWFYLSKNSLSDCNEKALQERLSVTLFMWKENCIRCGGNVKERSTERPPSRAITKSFDMEILNYTPKSETNNVIEFRIASYNSTLAFSFPFRAHTAYKLAVSFSWKNSDDVTYQTPAEMSANLFYNGVTRPTGVPPELYGSDVGEHSMTINWRQLRPQDRHGPLLGYEIYYTTNNKCFSGHNAMTCGVLYEASTSCNESFVRTTRFSLNTSKAVIRNSAAIQNGWRVEAEEEFGLLSLTLDELSRGTNYYIVVAAYNEAGRSECFGHIIQYTRNNTAINILLPCFLALVCAVALCFVLRYLRQRRACCWRQVPRPVLSVSLHAEEDSKTQQVNSETADRVYCRGGYVILADKESQERLLRSPESPNDSSNVSETVYRVTDESMITKLGVESYIVGVSVAHSNCDQASNSLDSDVPSCSTPSIGNGSVPSALCDDLDHATESEADVAIYISSYLAEDISKNERLRRNTRAACD